MTYIDPNTSLDDAVPRQSNYIKKEDCGEQGLRVTIAGLSQEAVKDGDKDVMKTVMHFNGDVKPLIMNQANKDILRYQMGKHTVGDLQNLEIELFNDMTVTYGDRRGGIRIRAPIAQSNRTAPMTRNESMAAEANKQQQESQQQANDDEIPF